MIFMFKRLKYCFCYPTVPLPVSTFQYLPMITKIANLFSSFINANPLRLMIHKQMKLNSFLFKVWILCTLASLHKARISQDSEQQHRASVQVIA